MAELRLMLRRGRDVWRLVPLPHKGALCLATLVMALSSVCNTALPLLFGRLLNDVTQGKQQGQSDGIVGTAAYILAMMGLAYLLREALNVFRRFLVENSCTRINRDMSVRLVAHLMKVNLGTLSQEKVGVLHGRIFRSVDGFMRFLRIGFLDFFPAVLTGTFALMAALSKQPLLGIVMLGVIPSAVYLTVRQLVSQKGVRLELIRNCEEIDGTVVEQLGGIEYVRAAHTERLEVQRMERATEKRRTKEIRHHFQMSLFGSAKALNEGIFYIVVVALSIFLCLQGHIDAGDMAVFPILFLSVMTPLAEVHRVLDEGHEASLRVGDLLGMLAEPVDPSFVTVSTREPRLEEGKPIIRVENLQLEYQTPQGQTVRALDGISLLIRHGETIGVAGRSGCGKTTWLQCLLRLHHACGGRVEIGGLPLEDVSRAEIGRLIGYVGQAPFVFAGTVAENIAYGNEHASPEAIRSAAELANLHKEILQMPRGYDTHIKERGQNLSGGQRQRLALARILLKQAPILILDEATSALDNISERRVQRALGVTRRDRTTIIVAHRLTTLRDCDRIYVFDDGRIVEVGSYHQLVHRGGVFAELVHSAEKGVGDRDDHGHNGKPAHEPKPAVATKVPPASRGIDTVLQPVALNT
jgi:ATP-binding cassette subfamily B protein